MKDDIAAPNLGQANKDYDAQFFWNSFRNIEQWMARILSKGPVKVTEIDADTVTTDTIEAASATITTLNATTLKAGTIIQSNAGAVTVPHTLSNSAGASALYVGPGGNTNIVFDDGHGFYITKDTKAHIDSGVFTGPTPLIYFDAAGVMNLLMGQITFPVTANPSANVNTLDDYEEGTWTPSLSFGGGTTGITYSTRQGRYSKVGNTVQLWAWIVLSAKGTSTGSAQVTGVPFTALGNLTYYSGHIGYFGGTSTNNLGVGLVGTTATISLYQANATLSDAAFGATTSFMFSASYEAA